MFQDLEYYIWRKLCEMCSDVLRSVVGEFDQGACTDESHAHQGPMKANFIPTTVTRASISEAIMGSGCMCIIPWMTWTVETHAYILHPGFKRVVRAALMMLARRGVHAELAVLVIRTTAVLMQDRQVVLNRYAFDDYLLKYNGK
jgi:hypothetical protein